MAPDHQKTRRDILHHAGKTIAGMMLAPICQTAAQNSHVRPGETPRTEKDTAARRLPITNFGAVGDGKTLNTTKIQAAIDHLAEEGGGTLIIPTGEFLTGAIFLKPGIHLHLEKNAILKGSTNRVHYPTRTTRIEGHFENWLPALINADKCDHLRIDGSGTLDGNGASFWREFRTRYAADPKTKNLDVPRPRLTLIENSSDVQIHGITFKDSGFWNLHLYRCKNVLVENARFEVPDNERCPSTDGTDIDSCQNIIIRGCTYRVDDDCICLKGSKGPLAMSDKDSPPVEHIHVENSIFERGHGVVTLGSEATVIRDVVVEQCHIPGKIPLVRLKLRPDTPQLYEDIHYRDITLSGDRIASSKNPIFDHPTAEIFDIRPWKQYFDLKGQPPPKSTVRNVTLTNIKGSYGSFGAIAGNPGQTDLSNFLLKDINVHLQDEKLKVGPIPSLMVKNVIINGHPLEIGHS